MNDKPITDDQGLEYAFMHDYAQFGVRINVDAMLTLLDAATTETDTHKRLCTAGLQMLFTSFEDFAILLQALLERKNGTLLQNEQDRRTDPPSGTALLSQYL